MHSPGPRTGPDRPAPPVETTPGPPGSPSPAVESLRPAPGAPSAPETVTIHTPERRQGGRGLEVPYDPQRIAILDMASLDILDALGVAGARCRLRRHLLDYLQAM